MFSKHVSPECNNGLQGILTLFLAFCGSHDNSVCESVYRYLQQDTLISSACFPPQQFGA
jgi:hypothetical protein